MTDSDVKAFSSAMVNHLLSLDDPIAIQSAACAFVLERLHAHRVVFIRVLSDSRIASISVEANRNDTAAQISPLTVLSVDRLREFRAGRPVVVPDVDALDAITTDREDHHHRLGVKAYVATPLVEDDVWKATMGVHQNAARAWSVAEVALVAESVQQTWKALNRARHEMVDQ